MTRPLQALLLFLALATPSSAAIQYVLAVSLDGLRGDFLRDVLKTAPAELPTFQRLCQQGAATFNARPCYTWNFTIGNHLSMVTGRPVLSSPGMPATAHHGYFDNAPPPGASIHADGNPQVPYKFSIFDMAHDRGLTTGAFLEKSRLTIICTSWDVNHGAADLIAPNNGKAKIDLAPVPNDTSPVPALVSAIQSGQLPNFTFLHIAYPDLTGHFFGWSIAPGAPYRVSMHNVDTQLGTILAAVDQNPLYAGKFAMIVTADHGGGFPFDNSHGDPTTIEDTTIPFLLLAPGITGGTDTYDWFENRFQPGGQIPTYLNPWQPLRNLDVANVAASLLGLPAVPGSIARPLFKRTPRIKRSDDGVKVTWPMFASNQTLEYTDDLLSNEWLPVTSGIVDRNTEWLYTVRNPVPPFRYFRLREK